MLIVHLGSPRPMSPRPAGQPAGRPAEVTPNALFENHSAGRSAKVTRKGGDPKSYVPYFVALTHRYGSTRQTVHNGMA